MKSFIELLSEIAIAIMLILAGNVPLTAQQKQLRQINQEVREIAMQHWSATEGLSQGMIIDIAIDNWGFVWISTKEGLNRFDGNAFKVFRHSSTDPKSISSNFVTSLLVDDKNQLWAGTYTDGLNLFDQSTETFTHFSLTDLNVTGPGSQYINSIQNAGNGRIIVSFADDLRVIEQTKKGFRISDVEAVYPGFNRVAQLDFNESNFICQSNGTLWTIDKNQVFRYTAKGLEQVLINHNQLKGNSSIKKLWENPFSKQVCLVLDNCLLQYDSTANRFIPWLELPAPFAFSTLIMADREGNILSNYKQHFYLRTNPRKQTFEIVRPMAVGLDDRTLMITGEVDKQGNIWLGSNGWGLFKIAPTNIFFKKIATLPGAKYNMGWLMRISKNGKNAVYDPAIISDWLTKFEKSDLRRKGFYKQRFDEQHTIAVDRDGNYWFYMNDPENKAVVFKMNAKSGSYEKLLTKKISATRDGFVGFTPIFSDKKGRILVSEYTTEDSVKLYLFDKGGKKSSVFTLPVTQKSPYGERTISDWAEDPDGILWLATNIGLFALSTETGEWKVYSEKGGKDQSLSLNKLLSVAIDPNEPQKYIWIGTEGGGLNRLDKTTGNVTVYTMEDGLPNNVIYSIQSDNRKNLWLSTNNGICLFNPKTLLCRNFNKSHGLPGNEFNRYLFSKSPTGEICLGGVGFNMSFNPEDFYTKLPPAKIVINGLKVLNKEINIDNQDEQKDKILSQVVEYTPKITLRHNQSMLSFRFALLDLKNPASNYYRYKLDGLYNEWVDNGKKNEATFTNIEPGDYTFIVSGHNGDGIWSKPAQMEVVIEPAWWQTWWFKAVVLITLGYLLYEFFKYRVSKAVEMEKLRNRIAQDLHDEIGSTLSSVSIYSSALSKSFKKLPKEQADIIDKISDSTINMMTTMNDIVWSINPANDSFENLVNRMRAYASSVTETARIKLSFENNLRDNKIQLTMLQRKNLYLIFKEAVNNSLKHADCTELNIKMFLTGNKLSLMVADNGKGMVSEPVAELTLGGNGIRNMHSRAKESNGSISIISNPDEGTIVHFFIDI